MKVIMWPSHDLVAGHWLGHFRTEALTLFSSLRSVILSPSLLSLSLIMSSLVSDFLLYTSFVCFVKWRVVLPLPSKFILLKRPNCFIFYMSLQGQEKMPGASLYLHT